MNFQDKSWQSYFKAKKFSLIKKRKRLGRQHVKFQMLKSFWVKHSITGELSKQARNLMLITYFSHDAYILIPHPFQHCGVHQATFFIRNQKLEVCDIHKVGI